MSDPFSQYRELELRCASPEVLILRLYEGALQHCRLAGEHQRAGRIAERRRSVSQAMAIVGELRRGLDFERGGEIATNLERVYDFVTDRLLETGVQECAEAMDEVVRVLEPLRQAWAELAAAPAGACDGASP